MSETTPASTEPASESTTQGEPDAETLGQGGKKALDAERTARKSAEQRANELQAQLDAISRANESALEKAQREATEARQAAQEAVVDALRYRIAAKHSISDADAELFLTGADEATLERQAARLVERAPQGLAPDPTQAGASTPLALNSDGLESALREKLGIR